jgi:hypothetical protein
MPADLVGRRGQGGGPGREKAWIGSDRDIPSAISTM